jgi:LPXTG-motif cell wall-anchored protein
MKQKQKHKLKKKLTLLLILTLLLGLIPAHVLADNNEPDKEFYFRIAEEDRHIANFEEPSPPYQQVVGLSLGDSNRTILPPGIPDVELKQYGIDNCREHVGWRMLPPPPPPEPLIFWINGRDFQGDSARNLIQYNSNVNLESGTEIFRVPYPNGLGGNATGALSFTNFPGTEHVVRRMLDVTDYYVDFIITLTDDGGISVVIEHNFTPDTNSWLPAYFDPTVDITREGISAPLTITLVLNMLDSYSTTGSYGINLTGIGGEGNVDVVDDIDVDNIAVDIDDTDPTSDTNRIIPDEEIAALLICTDEEIPSGTRFYAVFCDSECPEPEPPPEYKPNEEDDDKVLLCPDCLLPIKECICNGDEPPIKGPADDTRPQVTAPRTGDNTSTLPMIVGLLFSMSAVFGGISLKKRFNKFS